jgi:dihydrofolate reductase
VLTHRPAAVVTKQGGTSYTFVTGRVDDAMQQAQAAAGDAEVIVMGGAQIARNCLDAGLVDELRLHLVPVLLGCGTRLFAGLEGATISLESPNVEPTPGVTHLTYPIAT